MLDNDKTRVVIEQKARKRRPSARRHEKAQTVFVPPSKDKARVQLYLDNIIDWIKAHSTTLILLTIILLGVFLRIYALGGESIWLDEVSSIVQAKQNLSEVIRTSIDIHNSPPLYFIILHYQMLLFGSSEIAVRFPSAIFGIISIIFIYKIGYLLFNRKIGLISSFFLAISTFALFYSQDARPYSLFLLMTLLSFYFFIQILKINSKRYYLGYSLANMLLLYSHLFGLFVIISQIIYFAIFWKKYRQQRLKFAGVQVASVLASIPLVILLVPRLYETTEGGGSIGWISEPSFTSIVRTFQDFSGDGITLVIFLILCSIGLFSLIKREGRRILRFDSSAELVLLLMWLSFPIIIAFVLSMILTPMYVNRYLISALPAFLILAAKGTGSFPDIKVTYILLVIITLLSIILLAAYYSEPTKEPWRETVSYVEYHAQTYDTIILCADYTQGSFDYYYKGKLEKYGIARGATNAHNIDAVVDKAVVEKKRLWLILSNTGGAITEEHLLSRFGIESVIAAEYFVSTAQSGIKVYLFDLYVDSP